MDDECRAEWPIRLSAVDTPQGQLRALRAIHRRVVAAATAEEEDQAKAKANSEVDDAPVAFSLSCLHRSVALLVSEYARERDWRGADERVVRGARSTATATDMGANGPPGEREATWSDVEATRLHGAATSPPADLAADTEATSTDLLADMAADVDEGTGAPLLDIAASLLPMGSASSAPVAVPAHLLVPGCQHHKATLDALHAIHDAMPPGLLRMEIPQSQVRYFHHQRLASVDDSAHEQSVARFRAAASTMGAATFACAAESSTATATTAFPPLAPSPSPGASFGPSPLLLDDDSLPEEARWLHFGGMTQLEEITARAKVRLAKSRHRQPSSSIASSERQPTAKKPKLGLDLASSITMEEDDEVIMLSQAPQKPPPPPLEDDFDQAMLDDGMAWAHSISPSPSHDSSRRSSRSPSVTREVEAQAARVWEEIARGESAWMDFGEAAPAPGAEESEDDSAMISCSQMAAAASVTQPEAAATPMDVDSGSTGGTDEQARQPAPTESVTRPSTTAAPFSVVSTSAPAGAANSAGPAPPVPVAVPSAFLTQSISMRTLLTSKLSVGTTYQAIESSLSALLKSSAGAAKKASLTSSQRILSALQANPKLKAHVAPLKTFFAWAKQWRNGPPGEFDGVLQSMAFDRLSPGALFLLLAAFLDVDCSGARVRRVLAEALRPSMQQLASAGASVVGSAAAASVTFDRLVLFLLSAHEENTIVAVVLPWIDQLPTWPPTNRETPAQVLLQAMLTAAPSTAAPGTVIDLSAPSLLLIVQRMCEVLLAGGHHSNTATAGSSSSPPMLSPFLLATLAYKLARNPRFRLPPPTDAELIDTLVQKVQGRRGGIGSERLAPTRIDRDTGAADVASSLAGGAPDVAGLYLSVLAHGALSPATVSDPLFANLVDAYVTSTWLPQRPAAPPAIGERVDHLLFEIVECVGDPSRSALIRQRLNEQQHA